MVEEVRAEGRTVFLSSHTLSEVERVADRVGIIREGRLVVVERVDTLKQRAVAAWSSTSPTRPPPPLCATWTASARSPWTAPAPP